LPGQLAASRRTCKDVRFGRFGVKTECGRAD
jgi:hypothetical protein